MVEWEEPSSDSEGEGILAPGPVESPRFSCCKHVVNIVTLTNNGDYNDDSILECYLSQLGMVLLMNVVEYATSSHLNLNKQQIRCHTQHHN